MTGCGSRWEACEGNRGLWAVRKALTPSYVVKNAPASGCQNAGTFFGVFFGREEIQEGRVAIMTLPTP